MSQQKVEVDVICAFDDEKDKDLIEHYTPYSLLIASTAKELPQLFLTKGSKWKITFEEV